MTIRSSALMNNRAGEVSLDRARQPPFESTRMRVLCNCRGGGTLRRASTALPRPPPCVAEHSRLACRVRRWAAASTPS